MEKSVASNDPEFDREKWQADIRLREREIAVKEREQDIKDREVQAKIDEQNRSRWTNPLVLAVMAAALAAAGNAGVAVINGILQRPIEEERASSQNALEEAKGESARILEVIKTNDPDKAAVNLNFLLETGLITNKERRESLTAFLKRRRPGQGPALPAADIGQRFNEMVAYTCQIKDNRDASLIYADIKKFLMSKGGQRFQIAPIPANNALDPTTNMWIREVDDSGFAIEVKPNGPGEVRIGVWQSARRTRPDELVLQDASASVRELVPALVRSKVRELAVDPSCAT
jgi:hypothetical protein